MIFQNDFITTSLDLNVFFLRIMKEHSFFLEIGFTPRDANMAQEARNLKIGFERLLSEAVELANGNVSRQAITSNQFVTQYTVDAERLTGYYTGMPFNINLTQRELNLSPFNYFKNMGYPYVGVTVNVDITGFLIRVKENKLPFFLTFLYNVSAAANAVPEFRQRISCNDIIEYQQCKSSYTVALEDKTYCYCSMDCSMPFDTFLPYALKKHEESKQNPVINNGEDELSPLYVSTVPWFSYTALVQPVPQPADSNPRITWGKYFEQEGKTLISVSLLCNHALVDGFHMAQFYENLEKQLEGFQS